MDNLEEDAQETIATSTTTHPSSNSDNLATMQHLIGVVGGDGSGQEEQDFDDSVVFLQPQIDIVDLTTNTPPQPSTSMTTTTTSSAGAGLLKPKIEYPSTMDAITSTATSSSPTTLEDPSTSALSLAGASSSGDGGGGGLGVSGGAANTTTTATTNLLECPICLQTCIHPARLPCGHIFCFLCVKGVAYKNRRCAMCRREIPPEFLDHPQLVNGIEDICTTKATDDGYQWFYEGRNGGWWAYDQRTGLEIEEVFQMLHRHNQQLPPIKQEQSANVDVMPVKIEMGEQNNQTAEVKQERSSDDEDDEDEDEEEEDDYGGVNAVESPSMLIDSNAFTYKVQICGSMYILDFLNMVQYPQTMPFRKRKICRAKGLPAKGVAGISNFSQRRYRHRGARPYDNNFRF